MLIAIDRSWLLAHLSSRPRDGFSTSELAGEWLKGQVIAATPKIVGINACTRALERDIRETLAGNNANNDATTTLSASRQMAQIMLICRHDVNPPTLIQHFPAMVAAARATQKAARPHSLLHLVVLPTGSEPLLASVLGVGHCSVATLCLQRNYAVDQVASLQRESSWLDEGVSLFKHATQDQISDAIQSTPSIKLLRSTVPNNLTALNQQRKRSRKEARRKKRENKRARSTSKRMS